MDKDVENLKTPTYRELDIEFKKWNYVIEENSQESSPQEIIKLNNLRDQILKEEKSRIKIDVKDKQELEPYVDYIFKFMKQQPRVTTDYQLIDIPENDYLTLIEGMVEEELGITVEFFVLQTYSKPLKYGHAARIKSKVWLNYQEIMLRVLQPDLAFENESCKDHRVQLETLAPEGRSFKNWNSTITKSRV